MKVNLKRVDNDFHLEAIGASNVKVNIDAAEAVGGHGLGARPMELILMGLGSCSAIDIISILKKQKQVIEDFQIEIDASRREDETPAIFNEILVTYIFKGDLDETKIQKAIDLSVTKYCSVSKILEKSAVLKFNYKLNK